MPDLAKYRELRWLDRVDTTVPFAFALLLYGAGALLHTVAPQTGTSGWQMLIWGFFVSTVFVFHGSVPINSASHRAGARRFQTKDESRNSFVIALITLGEGWHNNHHPHPNSARQGFYWWEIDVTYYLLKTLSRLGIVWDLRPVPAHILRPDPPRVAMG